MSDEENEAKHTPGPWEVELDHDDPEKGIIMGEIGELNLPGTTICQICDHKTDRPLSVTKANARLIAAAPLMFKALETLCDINESFAAPHAGHLDVEALADAWKEVREAIAEAKGGGE